MAVCIAVIGKDNSPLYLRASEPSAELRHAYTIHTSLDVVEEKSGGGVKENYLGMLYPLEDFRVYGYVTNTKVKFVILVEASNANMRDNELRAMFRKLHAAYVDMFCNPFYESNTTITSRRFERVVSSMMVGDS